MQLGDTYQSDCPGYTGDFSSELVVVFISYLDYGG